MGKTDTKKFTTMKGKAMKATKEKRWNIKPAWEQIGRRNVWIMNLDELIKIVDSLFPTSKPKLACYNYGIERMPYGWVFVVTNSWQRWSDAKLEYQFGAYKTIEGCLCGFLEYIVKNKIQPHKLYNN